MGKGIDQPTALVVSTTNLVALPQHLTLHFRERVNQPRPPAMRAASGKDFSLSIATTPRAGPRAKNANAHRHPKTSSRNGINQIVGTVRAKPPASCSVRAVPT